MQNAYTTAAKLAVSMLTRIPVDPGQIEDSTWRKITWAFPICGYLVGFVAALPYWLFCWGGKELGLGIPTANAELIGAFFYVAGLAWMTRLFHLDGLCDVSDAFVAMRSTPEERLKIMKDPHPGAAGVTSLIFLILGKFVVIYPMLMNTPYLEERIALLVFIPAFARFAMAILAKFSTYPRKSGTGAMIVGNVSTTALILALITLFPILEFVNIWKIVPVALFVFAAMVYWRVQAEKRLGGVTGDVLGACCETCELAAGFALAMPWILF